MEVDHHKGLHPRCVHVQETGEEEEEKGWVLLSRGDRGESDGGGGDWEAGEQVLSV